MESFINLFIALVAYAIVVFMFCLAAKTFRKLNPRYSIVDDILLFGGVPFGLGCFLFILFNPTNSQKLISEVVNQNSTTMVTLAIWALFCVYAFISRNSRNKKR